MEYNWRHPFESGTWTVRRVRRDTQAYQRVAREFAWNSRRLLIVREEPTGSGKKPLLPRRVRDALENSGQKRVPGNNMTLKFAALWRKKRAQRYARRWLKAVQRSRKMLIMRAILPLPEPVMRQILVETGVWQEQTNTK